MAMYFHGHQSTRTNGQCTRPGWDAKMLGGAPTLVSFHHTRWSRRGRTPYAVCGLLWPHTSMATQASARMASARGPVGMQKCCGDPRHWFAPITRADRVAEARTTRCVDFYGHILLWPPRYEHAWPVHTARLGCRNVAGTLDIGLHPPHALIASRRHALPDVWTSMATYLYGHPRTCTNGQCTRPGWDAEMVGGPPTLVCTHHTGWSHRGCTHHPVCGLLWPHTSLATQVRARMASARGPVAMQKCCGDPRHWFALTAPAGRVADARTTQCVDFYGHILLWPPKYAHAWAVHAAQWGCLNIGRPPDIGLHPPHQLVASWTHALPGVWTSLATYFYGHPTTRTNGQCTRPGWDAELLGGPPTLVCTHHTRWSHRGCTRHPVCGLLWPHTSMATQVRARMGSAAARLGCFNIKRPPDIGLHPPHQLVASSTHALPGVWTSLVTYFYGHPSTRTNGQ